MSQEAERREGRYRALERAQRRRLWLSVVLPFGLALIVVAVFIGIALSLRSPAQVAIVSNSLLTLLVLCPSVALMFPIVILCIALVTLMSRWPDRTRSPLRRIEGWTAMLEANSETWLGRIDEQVLNWAVRLAPMRQLLRAFDPPDDERADGGAE